MVNEESRDREKIHERTENSSPYPGEHIKSQLSIKIELVTMKYLLLMFTDEESCYEGNFNVRLY